MFLVVCSGERVDKLGIPGIQPNQWSSEKPQKLSADGTANTGQVPGRKGGQDKPSVVEKPSEKLGQEVSS
jgi:hypothetical protein